MLLLLFFGRLSLFTHHNSPLESTPSSVPLPLTKNSAQITMVGSGALASCKNLLNSRNLLRMQRVRSVRDCLQLAPAQLLCLYRTNGTLILPTSSITTDKISKSPDEGKFVAFYTFLEKKNKGGTGSGLYSRCQQQWFINRVLNRTPMENRAL